MICFVQPNNEYQVRANKIALSLTFPQLICNLGLSTNYCVYIDGLASISFDDYIENKCVTHVFITCITSTFPRAVELSRIAKRHGCITVLGGIFATINHSKIALNYDCFNYIIQGGISSDFIDFLEKKTPESPLVLAFQRQDCFSLPLSPIMLSSEFIDVFDEDYFVCYELGNGCMYNCSFCTLRKAFGRQFRQRDPQIIQEDLSNLATKWHRLKLIDDDIYPSWSILSKLDLSGFDEIIVETRINHLTEEFLSLCKAQGITHIISGVEAFNNSSLNYLNKSADKYWGSAVQSSVELCDKYGIMLRPVVMLNPPFAQESDLLDIIEQTKNWQPEHHVELLLSLFTPHPGMPLPKGKLLTNYLPDFDHLHLVYVPASLSKLKNTRLIEYYNYIVAQTKSESFNPSIKIRIGMFDEYKPFFVD